MIHAVLLPVDLIHVPVIDPRKIRNSTDYARPAHFLNFLSRPIAAGWRPNVLILGNASAGDAAMLDRTQESHEALEIAEHILERTIFGGVLFALVVVVFGMLKGLLG